MKTGGAEEEADLLDDARSAFKGVDGKHLKVILNNLRPSGR